MKKPTLVALAAAAVVLTVLLVTRLVAAEKPLSAAVWEYATIRWSGRDNTHVIRPGGRTEIIGAELRRMKKPDGVDERSFYLNIAMNGLSKEGYEIAALLNDEVVMKRLVER